MRMGVLDIIVLLVAATLVSALDEEASVFNDNGNLVLAPAANQSVVIDGKLLLNGSEVVSRAEFSSLVASLENKVTQLEQSLASCPCACATTYSRAFISVWNTENAGVSNSDQIALPLETSGTYNFTAAWGDGTSDRISAFDQSAVTHTYGQPGNYTLEITGTILGWRFDDGGDKFKILDIKQWGSLQLGNNGSYFYNCANMDISASDAPNLTGTSNLSYAFHAAHSLSSPDFSKWDVSHVVNMNHMFYLATQFNGNIDKWDVSRVTDMNDMFHSAGSFNGNISMWNVSAVKDMSGMFYGVVSFDQDVSQWDVSNVQNMGFMFNGAMSFDKPIDRWNVSQVFGMNGMFRGATSFNQNLSPWCVVLINPPAWQFDTTSTSWTLPRPIWGSCPSRVVATSTPFISTWKTNNLGVSGSNQITVPLESSGTYDFVATWGDGTADYITAFDAATVTHTYSSPGTYTISLRGTIVGWRFNDGGDKLKILDIRQWGDIRLGDSKEFFRGARNLAVSATDTLCLAGTTKLDGIFRDTRMTHIPGIESWDVSHITDFRYAFYESTFTGSLAKWNMSSAITLRWMFWDSGFNGNVSTWDVSAVTDFGEMFFMSPFVGDVGLWDVSSARDMEDMFKNTPFNGNVGLWNVSSVTDMSGMFESATSFNQDLSSWCVANINIAPTNFDTGANSWALPRPNWGTCR